MDKTKRVVGLIVLVIVLLFLAIHFFGFLGLSILGMSTIQPTIGTFNPEGYYNYSGIDGSQIHLESNIATVGSNLEFFVKPTETYSCIGADCKYRTNPTFFYLDNLQTSSCSLPTWGGGISVCSPVRQYTNIGPNIQFTGIPLREDEKAYGLKQMVSSSVLGKHYLIISKAQKDCVSYSPYVTCSCSCPSIFQEDSSRCGWLSTQETLKIPIYFESELCKSFNTSTYVLAGADFVGGQTITNASLQAAMGNQTIKAFCPSKLPAVLLNPDSNAIIDLTTIPYESLEANSYYTVPAGQLLRIYAITTRPPQIGYSCEEKQYYDGVRCQPVLAFLTYCSGQVSTQGYCLTETIPLCSKLVANSFYNVDEEKCNFSIPPTGDVIVPVGCVITEYDSTGRPKVCEFDPEIGCAIGSLITENGETYCKIGTIGQPFEPNIWQKIGSIWNSFWAWLLGLFGW